MNSIADIPELGGRSGQGGLVRIPPELDVPLSPRVRRLIDTSAFRRLARISQLGLVSLVYPAANHSRQEHSLGVYRVALEYLARLAADERFAAAVSPREAEEFLIAALLHDIGHWPFCHPIEDIRLPSVPTHEELANSFFGEDELAGLLRDDWDVQPSAVVQLLRGGAQDNSSRIRRSMLAGPIDVDKVDYLMRDSLHAGVPYGRNFDQSRLVQSLCLNRAGSGLAITEKGKTAAELMVFARYVMFSEVYWHHAVRAATAMFQRAFFELHETLPLEPLFRMTEHELIAALRAAAEGQPAGELLDGLFGTHRRLYKQVAEYSVIDQSTLYRAVARRPYPALVECGRRLAELVERGLGQPVAAHEVLFDAPPVKLEVQFDIDVYDAKRNVFRGLGDVSPVVRTLAREQFDDYVKRVRVFVHPRLREPLSRLSSMPGLIAEAVAEAESRPA